ncbi:MAG: DEAD/DEAH box helicase [Lentisphaeria bacterium]|jgi:superfamily II DNA or RNA helicase
MTGQADTPPLAAVLAQFAEAIGPGIHGEARHLCERGHVLDLQRSGQQVVTARVMTLRGGVEDVRLRFTPERVSPSCTCGRSRHFCAHALAVLLQLAKRGLLAAGPRPGQAGDIRVQAAERLAWAVRLASWRPGANGTPCAIRGLVRPGTLAGLALKLAVSGIPARECPAGTRLRLDVAITLDGKEYGPRHVRMMLETGDGGLPFRFADFTVPEQEVLQRLGKPLAAAAEAAALELPVEEWTALLPWLAGSSVMVNGQPVRVLGEPPRPVLLAAETDDGLAIQVRAGLRAGAALLDPERSVLLPGRREAWVWCGDLLAPLPVGLGGEWADVFAGGAEDVLGPAAWRELAAAAPEQWRLAVEIRAGGGRLLPAALAAAGPEVLLYLDWCGDELRARLEFQYGESRLPAGAPPGAAGVRGRFPEVERQAATVLGDNGFVPREAGEGWLLREPDRLWSFWREGLDRLPPGWRIFLSQAAARARATTGILRLDVQPGAAAAQDWFELDCRLLSEQGAPLPWKQLAQAVRSGAQTVLLAGGQLVHITEQIRQTVGLLLGGQEEGGGRIRFSKYHAPVLAGALGGHPALAGADWLQLSRRLAAPPSPDPALFTEEQRRILRGYQKEGVGWLRTLDECGFHGVLADEMGLGKTIQALVWLAWRRRQGLARQPALVICPTSLTDNWRNEAARFAPGLRTLVVAGIHRHDLLAAIPDHDLVITSYALLRRDSRHYRALEFDAVVLDEAQHIKNPGTENARACKQLRCARRLILTGTPLENALHELWSLFDFLLPGYLGTRQEFKHRHEDAAAVEADAGQELATRIRPFILRRLKADVCQELPPKTERLMFSEMEPPQARLYASLLLAGRQLLDAAKADGWGRHRFQALSLLTRLRQLCCHPDMLPENLRATAGAHHPLASAKTELLQELVLECIDSGNRVLLFSQFTSFLKIFRGWLDAEGVAYEYLDGATRDRQARVDRFNRDASIPLFLISLKAGGTGLNLTGADTVIHYDPWWNPMVEDQATDRTHRIGQQRPVTVIKLLVRNTVEEKIQSLQQRKRLLFQQLLGQAPARPGELTPADLEFLLAEG